MNESDLKRSSANVNVTLRKFQKVQSEFEGRQFPCPLCSVGLPLHNSKRNKPYCTCNGCGIQVFFRGREGISRLRKLAQQDILASTPVNSSANATALYNRLKALELKKRELQGKQGIIFRDTHLENTIEIIEAEIKFVQGALAQLAEKMKNSENKRRNSRP